MSDGPLTGARRFEAFVRRSTYGAVALPVATLLGSALAARGAVGANPTVPAVALGSPSL